MNLQFGDTNSGLLLEITANLLYAYYFMILYLVLSNLIFYANCDGKTQVLKHLRLVGLSAIKVQFKYNTYFKQALQWIQYICGSLPRIITDRIRSMGEGKVFTHVCLSICPTLGGGGSHVTFPQSFGATLYKHVHQARPIILVSGEQR